MNNHLFNLWPVVLDMTDVILIWFILYQVSFLFSNTRSKKIIVGSAIIGAMYVISITLHLEGISEVFKAINLVQIGSIVLVIIFSQEIKDALTTIGIKRVQYVDEDIATIEAINQACLRLSSNHVGALILLARRDNLIDLANDAIPIKADVTSQILESIFFEPSVKAKGGNPLHDGAVIISGNKILAAKVICKQLSESIELSHQGKGTRHAAGLGFSEQSDCVAIMISHETGQISLAAHNEKTIWDVQSADLLQELKSSLGMNIQKSDLLQDINRWFLNRKIAKTVSLVIAIVIWCISNSVLTISSNTPQPNIYQHNHLWQEGDFVLELAPNQSPKQNVKIEIKNWQRIVYLLRSNEGGRHALQNALSISTTKETINKSIQSAQDQLALKLEVNKRFKNEIKLLESEENKNLATFHIKKLVKVDLKDLIRFNIKDHHEVEKITARTSSEIFIPNNFKPNNILTIDLLSSNNPMEKIETDIWHELQGAKKFRKDYPDFSGILHFSKVPSLKSLAKFNKKINVNFGISLFIKGQDVKPSESEITLNKSLAAVQEKYKNSPDKLIGLAKVTKPDRSQVITARNQMKKAKDDLDEIKTQLIQYKSLFDSKKKTIKINNETLRNLKSKSSKTDLETKRIAELEDKVTQIPRERTICSKIQVIYSNNMSLYETRANKSQAIYEKYAVAFEPVLKVYKESKIVFLETQKVLIPKNMPETLDNINDLIKKVKGTDFRNKGADISYLRTMTKALDEYLISKLIRNKPGSLHFLKLERKKLYEKMDLILNQVNIHLNPTAKMPLWPDLHKVQTFKLVENVGLQKKQIQIIDAKIISEKKSLKKIAKLQEDLFKQLGNKLDELKKKSSAKINVALPRQVHENLKQDIDELKILINKNIIDYQKSAFKLARTPKYFELSLVPMDTDIVNLFYKELNQLPTIYNDYTTDSNNNTFRKGFFIVNQTFNSVNGQWGIMVDSISEKTEKPNVSKLKQYLSLLIELEDTMNVYHQ